MEHCASLAGSGTTGYSLDHTDDGCGEAPNSASRLGVGRAALLTILAGASLVRFWGLWTVPPPTADEVFASVDLKALLTTGRHFDGAHIGLLGYITPLLDGRLVIGVFGTSVPMIRIAPAVFGVGTVLCAYLLGLELFDETAALIGAAAIAVLPWNVYLSRLFFPASEVAFLTALSLYLLLRAIRTGSMRSGVVAVLAGSASIYLYPVAAIMTPLLGCVTIACHRREAARFGWSRAVTLILVGAAVLSPFAAQHLFPTDSTVAQANQVAGAKLITASVSGVDRVLGTVLHNWLSLFSLRYLLVHGDPNVRTSTQAIGQVGWVILPIGIVGFIAAVARRSRADLLLLVWLLVFPLVDAVTAYDAPGNSVRTYPGAFIWALLAGRGGAVVITLARKRRVRAQTFVVVCLVGAIAAQGVLFCRSYFGTYVHDTSYAFETGYSPVLPILRSYGISKSPITYHGGYQGSYILNYFSDDRLDIPETVPACYPLPPDLVRYTVLPAIIVVREDPAYSMVPGCVRSGLIEKDLSALRSVPGRRVQVLAEFPNAPTGPWYTAVLWASSASSTPLAPMPNP